MRDRELAPTPPAARVLPASTRGCVRTPRRRVLARLLTAVIALTVAVLTQPVAVRADPTGSPASSEGPLPWPQGSQVAGWKVEAVETHAEFQRFTLSQGPQRTRVELVACPRPTDPWCAKSLRLQPAPGAQPPETLLHQLLTDLRRFEERQAQPTVAARQAPGWWQRVRPVDLAFLAADLTLLLGALALTLVWLRPRRALWPWAAGSALLATGWSVAVLGHLTSMDLPVDWLTPLHEGTTRQAVDILHGRNGHAGPHQAFLAWLTSDGDALGLRQLVRLNVWASGLAAALVLLPLRAVTGRGWAAVGLLLAFAWAAPARLTALSEVEAPVTAVFLLLAVPAGAVLAEATGTRLRRLAVAHLVLATGLVGLVRTELAGPGLVALAVLAWQAWGPKLSSHLGLLRQRLRQPRVAVAVGLGLGLVATLPLLWLPGRIGWLVAGLHPANPSILTLPAALMALLPPGMVVLVVAGVVAGLRWPGRALGLGLAAIVLYRVYFCASHRVWFEMVRYLAGLWPLLLLLAAAGVTLLAGLPRRARLAVLLLCLVPPIPATAWTFWDWQPGHLPWTGPLDTDHQREMRFLVRTAEQNPACVLVTRVTAETERVDAPKRYDYALFGKPVPVPVHVPAEAGPAAAVASRFPQARCALFVRALDCHLRAGQPCEAEVRGLPMARAERFNSRPYNDAYEYGATVATIELAAFQLRGSMDR